MKLARLRSVLLVLFWLALIFTFFMALNPQPPLTPLGGSDKSQHMFAFAVLTLLACVAYPRQRLLVLFLVLAVVGGLIEVLQMIPALHRDADVYDWLADCAAIAAVLALWGGVR